MLDRSLIVFIPACDPDEDSTVDFMLAADADVIELGIPFSDPVADGATIQRSYDRALRNFRLAKIFRILRKFRESSDKPVVVMSYFNPIYSFGVRRFVEEIAACGATHLLVVDLPVDEAADVVDACGDAGVGNVFLAAPNTSEERLRAIDEASDFVYLVSTYGTTGERDRVSPLAFKALERAKKVCRKPVAIGFGVSRREHVEELFAAGADGVVVGSAVVRLIEEHGKNAVKHIAEFTRSLRPE